MLETFFKQAAPHIAAFNAFIEKHALKDRVRADHICYKCASRESFQKIRALFEYESEYIYQSIISGRPIAIIKFKTGIETDAGTINFLELSDQKPDQSQRGGFDHIEAYPIGWSYEEMVAELTKTEKVLLKERPYHTTHDIEIADSFFFRCTQGPLIEKIRQEEIT